MLQQHGLSAKHAVITTHPEAVYQNNYHSFLTYIIRFQLHSAAEDESVEVGLLEDLVESGFILKL